MPFELMDNVNARREEQGSVQHLEHFQQSFVSTKIRLDATAFATSSASVIPAITPQALAEQYLRVVAPIYGFDETMLSCPAPADSLAAAEAQNAEAGGSKLELVEENELMGTTTVEYQQTYNHLPIWEAGVSVTIQAEPMRVTASQSSNHKDVALPHARLSN